MAVTVNPQRSCNATSKAASTSGTEFRLEVKRRFPLWMALRGWTRRRDPPSWLARNDDRGIRRRIHQGSAIQRPSVLDLAVEQDGTILVSGAVREIGRGTLTI